MEVLLLRVLVVEDEKNLNELIVKKLKLEHYSVDACLRGDDALDYLCLLYTSNRRVLPEKWICL